MIAFSRRKIVEVDIPGQNASDFIAAFCAALDRAHWAEPEAVTGGFKYLVESKQSLKAKFIIKELSSTKVSLQWHTESESFHTIEYCLTMKELRTFRCIIGHCQYFIWVPGYYADDQDGDFAHNSCGGIPYVMEAEITLLDIDGECGVVRNNEITTEIFWASGFIASGFPGSPVDTLRSELILGNFCGSGCRNADVSQDAGKGNSFTIPSLRHPISGNREKTIWVDDAPVFIDPFLMWPDSLSNPPRIRGQIWDAMLACHDYPFDDPETDVDVVIETEEITSSSLTITVPWINYTAGYYSGTLFLKRPMPIDVSVVGEVKDYVY